MERERGEEAERGREKKGMNKKSAAKDRNPDSVQRRQREKTEESKENGEREGGRERERGVRLR